MAEEKRSGVPLATTSGEGGGGAWFARDNGISAESCYVSVDRDPIMRMK